MDNLQSALDQIQQSLVNLTGAVNRHVEQINVIELRLNNLESSNAQVQNTTSNALSPLSEADLAAITKLPDGVKDLQVFDGNPIQYISWVHNVESILKDYEVIKNKPLYRAILKHIRQKIRGEADNALISYNIFDDQWPEIKKCLSLHYADKRDIQSLENQLIGMRQGRNSVAEFYGRVNHQLSLIINKIKTDDYSEEGKNVLVENYRHRALDVFIRGLQQNLSQLVKVQRPLNLPEAYAACLELQNMDFRKTMSYSETETRNWNRNNNYQNNTMLYQRNYALPVNNQKQVVPPRQIPNPMPFKTPFEAAPPRPNNPKPPVPMEVDPSIRTARLDYMNRPRPVVRHSNESSQIPNKQQRVFNIDTERPTQELEDEYLQNYDGPTDDEVNFMIGASLESPT